MSYDIVLFTGVERPQIYATTRPFGAYKCARELRKAGFSVLVINFAFALNDQNLKLLLNSAVGANTLFVGFSNSFMNNFIRRKIQYIADHTHQINANTRIVVGGAAASQDTQFGAQDYVIVGFADRSIVNLAQHLQSGQELRHSHRSALGHTIIEDWAEDWPIESDYFEWHPDDIVIARERTLPLEISRGCIFDCSFCAHRFKGKQNGDYIKRTEIIEQELLFNYHNYGITHYRILDDTYNDNKEKIRTMAEMVSRLPFKPKFWGYMRLDLLDKHPETIDTIIETGVSFMCFGIETFNRTAGRAIGKGYNPDKLIARLADIKQRYGDRVVLFGNFIVGLPGETLPEIQELQRKLYAGEIALDSWKFMPLIIARNLRGRWDSAFGLDMSRFGYVDQGDADYSGMKNVPSRTVVNWRNEHMTYEQAQTLADHRDFAEYGAWELLNFGREWSDIVKFLKTYRQRNSVTALLETMYRKYVADYLSQALSHATGSAVTVGVEDLVGMEQDFV